MVQHEEMNLSKVFILDGATEIEKRKVDEQKVEEAFSLKMCTKNVIFVFKNYPSQIQP